MSFNFICPVSLVFFYLLLSKAPSDRFGLGISFIALLTPSVFYLYFDAVQQGDTSFSLFS